jgi:hypothetical protein
LESYHLYLLPQEVSKTPITLGTYGSLPKIRKGRFGSLNPLGVNMSLNELSIELFYTQIGVVNKKI